MPRQIIFEDEKFLSKEQKGKILKNWIRFIKSGFKKGNFTDAIYQHLHLHCGFIAHYDRIGFYNEYFTDPQNTIRFIDHFERECPLSWKHFENDLTSVMMQELENFKPKIFKETHEKNLKKTELEFELAKRNLDDARKVMGFFLETRRKKICRLCNVYVQGAIHYMA